MIHAQSEYDFDLQPASRLCVARAGGRPCREPDRAGCGSVIV